MLDKSCYWYVDYNMEYIDEEVGLFVGILKIFVFLIYDNKKVCFRGVF